ncbi:MAG: FAD-dependent oxidoreductase, partial [Caulobacteraceae bacterium]
MIGSAQEGRMAEYAPPVLKSRREQMMFPLTEAEIERVRRFGEVRRFAQGAHLARAGEAGLGMAVLLSGRVKIVRRDGLGAVGQTTEYGKHHFIAEVGQLSGRAAFVDVIAQTAVEALMVPPERLRGLITADAELGERIMRALILRRVGLIEAGTGGPVLVGPREAAGMARLQNFLGRNGIPYRLLDPETEPDARALLASAKPERGELPIVLSPDGTQLRNPSEHELAARLGLLPALDPQRRYDVAVVGAGPAGLATAVYAASEGLAVVVLEAEAIGGQAGASARIENYLGFPTGITGQALAGRAFSQAQKFGAEIAIGACVERLVCAETGEFRFKLADGTSVTARTVVIASGAEYRRPAFVDRSEMEPNGVHYWASPVEANLCSGQEVALVGGGNSAGQAAVFLASRASKVWMLVRRNGLEATMSRYLIDRITAQPDIELVAGAEVQQLELDDARALRRIVWRDKASGRLAERPLRHLFLFIGADPCTSWLEGCVESDPKGFVITGKAARPADDEPPFLMTSRDGVFAIGDVRSGS